MFKEWHLGGFNQRVEIGFKNIIHNYRTMIRIRTNLEDMKWNLMFVKFA